MNENELANLRKEGEVIHYERDFLQKKNNKQKNSHYNLVRNI
jgi:hypothetical protein